MGQNTGFIRVGAAQVNLDSRIKLSELARVRELAQEVGGLSTLKVLLDLLVEIEQTSPIPSAGLAR